MYGEKVDEAQVSYEPQSVDPGTGKVRGGYYFRTSDDARVVYVNPSNEESVSPRGFFALYEGPPEAYVAVVQEAG